MSKRQGTEDNRKQLRLRNSGELDGGCTKEDTGGGRYRYKNRDRRLRRGKLP